MICDGGFADVYLDFEENLAYKLFRSYINPSANLIDKNEIDFNIFAEKVFDSEVQAYKLITASDLKDYFPKYYPDYKILAVIDEFGNDVSTRYILSCTLVLELINGKFEKHDVESVQICLNGKSFNKEDFFNSLKSIGVNFSIDCSVCCNSETLKFIDIARNDFSDFE